MKENIMLLENKVVFTSIMKNVLKDKANIPFRIPENIELIKIDRTTGKRPTLISKQKTKKEML